MILRQIGEDSDFKLNSRYALQHQCMRGDLHDHMGATRNLHLPEQLLQLIALRCRALGVQYLVSNHILDGSNESHLCPDRLLQHGFEQISHRGFTIGAGYADHRHFVCRMPKPVG